MVAAEEALTGLAFSVSLSWSVGFVFRCLSVPLRACFTQKATFIPKRTGAMKGPYVLILLILWRREGFISPYKLLINKEIKITLGKYTQKYTHRELTAV
jgi:hypothetical protein